VRAGAHRQDCLVDADHGGRGQHVLGTGAGADLGVTVGTPATGVAAGDSWPNADRGDRISIRLGDRGNEIDLALPVDTVQEGSERSNGGRAAGEPTPVGRCPERPTTSSSNIPDVVAAAAEAEPGRREDDDITIARSVDRTATRGA